MLRTEKTRSLVPLDDSEERIMLVRIVDNVQRPVKGGFDTKKRQRSLETRQRRRRDKMALDIKRGVNVHDIDCVPIAADRSSFSKSLVEVRLTKERFIEALGLGAIPA